MNDRATLREKISYGLCGVVYETECMFVLSYLTLFCTDVLLIDAAKIGVLFLFAKILDAITDIVVTNLADKTETRFGKYRPWLLSGVFLAVFMTLNFVYPSFLKTENSKLIWVCVIYILTVPVFETSFMCPYLVMGSVISYDPKDRMEFQAAKAIGENVSDFLVNALAMTIVLSFGDYRSPKGWFAAACVFAVVMSISALLGFAGVKERVKVTNKTEDGKNLTFDEKLALLRGNKAYFKLLLVQFGFMFAWMASITLFSYYCINVLGREDWVASLSTIGVVAQLLTTVLIPRLAGKVQKRMLIFIGSLLVVISGVILIFTSNYFSAVIYQIIRGVGIGFVYISVYTLWTDMTDYVEYSTGTAAPGIVYAIESFSTKIFVAISSFYAANLVKFSGYDAILTTQSENTLLILKYGVVAVMVLGGAVSCLANMRLKELSEENLEKYRRALSSKRTERAEAE